MLVSKLEECIIKDLNDEFSYNHVEILHLQHKFSNLVHSITYVPFFVSSYQYDSTTYHFCISSQVSFRFFVKIYRLTQFSPFRMVKLLEIDLMDLVLSRIFYLG